MNYKVIIQLANSEEEVIKSLLSHVKNLRKGLGEEAEILIVCHARSLDFVLSKNENFKASVRLLLSFKATIAACENMLKAHDNTKEELHEGIETVPSAIVALVVKQQEGWSYIKAGF